MRGGGCSIPGPSDSLLAAPMTWRNSSCSSFTRHARRNACSRWSIQFDATQRRNNKTKGGTTINKQERTTGHGTRVGNNIGSSRNKENNISLHERRSLRVHWFIWSPLTQNNEAKVDKSIVIFTGNNRKSSNLSQPSRPVLQKTLSSRPPKAED